jgi:hypothetical protein
MIFRWIRVRGWLLRVVLVTKVEVSILDLGEEATP